MSVCSEGSNPAETIANGGSGRETGASRVRKTADRNGFRITIPVALFAKLADWAKASVLVGGDHVDQGSGFRCETGGTQVADTDQSSDFMVCERAPPRFEWFIRSNSLSRDTAFVDLEWLSGAGRLYPSGRLRVSRRIAAAEIGTSFFTSYPWFDGCTQSRTTTVNPVSVVITALRHIFIFRDSSPCRRRDKVATCSWSALCGIPAWDR